jgi:hypothetical protein
VACFGVSRTEVFGNAGMIGTAGTVGFFAGFAATGVVSPGVAEDGCVEEGVVGVVEVFSSDWGWFVDGVSGRGISGTDSTAAGSSASVVVAC